MKRQGVWHKGFWAPPTFVLAAGSFVMLRLEYRNMEEPLHIKKFRDDFEGLQNFTWIPRSNEPEQEFFVRRWWTENDKGYGHEFLIWSRLDNTYVRFSLDGDTWGLVGAVVADMNINKMDKRRAFSQRSEAIKVKSRMALDENGENDWVQVDGKWHKDLSRREAWLRQSREDGRSMKGGTDARTGSPRDSEGGGP